MDLFQHFIDGHDVGMPQRHHHSRFAQELLRGHRIIRVAFPQYLNRAIPLGLAMLSPVDAGEGPRPDHILDLVIPVEVAVPLPLDQPIDLEIGQQLLAHRQRREVIERHIPATQFTPNRLQLMGVDEVTVKCPLGELFRRQIRHG